MKILTSPDGIYAYIHPETNGSAERNEQESRHGCLDELPCPIPRYHNETIRQEEHPEPVFVSLQRRIQFGISCTKSFQPRRQRNITNNAGNNKEKTTRNFSRNQKPKALLASSQAQTCDEDTSNYESLFPSPGEL